MEKTLAKTLIALVIGLTVGLFSGYSINYKTYSWFNPYDVEIRVSKEQLAKEIEKAIIDFKTPTNFFNKIERTEQEIIDYKTSLWQYHTLKKFNFKVALLSGSPTATILIVLLLGSGLKKKTE
jgi:hypothetical protein